ncbi:MAG: bile acid:sodium symporter family protein [Candidatus Desulfacyla sp.]
MKSRVRFNSAYIFVLLLAAAVGLAWIVPEPGAKGGWLHTGITTRVAVFLIFVMQGLSLPTQEVRKGLVQYRLHMAIQVFIFVFIPALVYAGLLLSRRFFPYDLYMGFLFLAAVPTTISTSIVFTTEAGGASAVALFNASLSNVLGVFAVPLWVSLQVSQKTPIPPLDTLIFKIMLIILLPFTVGQVVRRWVRPWADAHKRHMSKASMGLILFIIYAAFCNSVKSDIWQSLKTREISLAFFSTLLLLILVMLAGRIWWKTAGYEKANGIAFFFSATQKAISTGVPMAYAIFASSPISVALVILPLLFYHPLQLLLGSFIVGRWSRT